MSQGCAHIIQNYFAYQTLVDVLHNSTVVVLRMHHKTTMRSAFLSSLQTGNQRLYFRRGGSGTRQSVGLGVQIFWEYSADVNRQMLSKLTFKN